MQSATILLGAYIYVTNITEQENGHFTICDRLMIRPVYISAQSDQSSLCLSICSSVAIDSVSTQRWPDENVRMHSLISALIARMFKMAILLCCSS